MESNHEADVKPDKEFATVEPKSGETAKRRSRKLWISLIILLVVLPLGLLIGAKIAITKTLTPESLVAEVEERYNVRLAVESVDISLFSAPAKIRLEKVQVGHRDNVANEGKVLAERPPIPTPVLEFEFIEMEASLLDALFGEIRVKRMTLGPGAVLGRVRGNGEVTLAVLVDKPEIVNGKKNPKKNPKERSTTGEKVKSKGGRSLTFSGMESFEWQKTQLKLEMNGRKTLLEGTDLTLNVGKIELDEDGNSVAQIIPIQLTGVLRVIAAKKDIQQARFELDGKLAVVVDDSGEMSEVAIHMGFGEGSTISVLPTLEKLKKKIEKFKQLGIDIDERLADSVTFPPGGSVLQAQLKDGRLTTLEPFMAVYGDFDVFAEKDGYINLADNDHFFNLRMLASEELSSYVRVQLREKAGMIPTEKTRERFLIDAEKSIFNDERLEIRATSKDDFGDPDVDIVNDLPKAEDYLREMLGELGVGGEDQKQLEEAGKNLLQELFK